MNFDDAEAYHAIAACCDWGSIPLAKLTPRLDSLWEQAAATLDAEWLDGMRFMSWEEARHLMDSGVELGAHTVNHPHLARSSDPTRRWEITESVNRVRELSRVSDIFFAYPYGRSSDFGHFDISVLRELQVPLAVSTRAVANCPDSGLCPHQLGRLPVSRCRTQDEFLAMMSGLYDEDRRWRPPD